MPVPFTQNRGKTVLPLGVVLDVNELFPRHGTNQLVKLRRGQNVTHFAGQRRIIRRYVNRGSRAVNRAR